MGDAITWGHANCNAVILNAIADVPIGGIATFQVAGNSDDFNGILVNGYPAKFRYTDDEHGYEISETVNPFTKQRVDDFLVGDGWKFHVQFHLGHDDQGADPWMVANVPSSKWDATAVGKNLAYARAFCFYDSDIFSGLPTFAYYVNGALMYNPAKDSTVGGSGPHRWGDFSTYEVSVNPSVIAYNIGRGFFNSKGDLVYGSGYEPEDLPLDFWIPAIQACDELITDKDGTQSPRYTCGFEIDITEEPRKYLQICETAMAGRITEDRGQLLAYAGVEQTPIFSFTDGDKVQGAANLYDAKLGLDNLKNTVTGRFLSVAECFAQVDAPPRESVDDIAADGGIPLVDNMDLSMITHGPTAQRIMEATRKRHRAQATCTRTFRLPALNARKGQWIAGTSADWIGTKWFEIVKAVPDLETLCVTLSLREVPYNLGEWVASRDELDRYTISLPAADPVDPLAATGIGAVPLSEQSKDGTSVPGFSVNYSVLDDPTAKEIQMQVGQILASGNDGVSTTSTHFSDDVAFAFTSDMVNRIIVIDGVDTDGTEYTGIIDALDSAEQVFLNRPTSVNEAGRKWMVIGDTKCFYDPDVTSGQIKASNLLGNTPYAYRVRIGGIEGRQAIWSAWHTISTVGAVLPSGSVGGEQLKDEVSSAIAAAWNDSQAAKERVQKTSDDLIGDLAKIRDDLADFAANMAEATLGQYSDIDEIRQTAASNLGEAKAHADSVLIAATGPGSVIAGRLDSFQTQINGKVSSDVTDAIASRLTISENNLDVLAGRTTSIENVLPAKASTTITDALASRMTSAENGISSVAFRTTSIENELPGKASAQALSDLSNTVSNLNGVLTEQGSALTSLQGAVGSSSSSAIMQLYQAVSGVPADATSRFVLSLATNSNGTSHSAAFFMDSTANGSRLVGAADLIAFYAAKFQILNSAGDPLAVFNSDGTVFLSRLPGLTYKYNYTNIGGVSNGATKSDEGTTVAVPSEPAQVAISAHTSVYYYKEAYRDIWGAVQGYGYLPRQDATVNTLEAKFYFRVQNGSVNTIPAAIEYFDGSSWKIIPGSLSQVVTSSTDARASLSVKAVIPPEALVSHPIFWNPTGNTIWMMSVSVFPESSK